jgi:hypothetical protein
MYQMYFITSYIVYELVKNQEKLRIDHFLDTDALGSRKLINVMMYDFLFMNDESISDQRNICVALEIS